MKGLLLAAGLGTRLRPLTDRMPKPLVPVVGRPCIVPLLETFARLGIVDLAINTHWLPEQLHDALGDGSRWGVRLHWQHEPSLLDGCGTLRSFDWLFGDEPVLCANADVVHDLDLAAALDAHRASGAPLTLVAVPHHGPLRQMLGWDELRRLRQVRDIGLCDRRARWLGDFSGFHVVEPRIWREFIPAGRRYHLTTELCPALLAAGVPVHVHPADGVWATLGDRAGLDRAAAMLLHHRCGRYFSPADREPAIWQAASARVEGLLVPPVYLGEGAVVETGAALGPCASLEAGAVLRAGERLRDGCRLPDEG